MVVDTSAVVAIVLKEPRRSELLAALDGSDTSILSAPSYLESHMVLRSRLGPHGALALDEVMREWRIAVVAFSVAHASAAIDAFDRYGKGRHPAALNFGDCVSYAVAKDLRSTAPLYRQRLLPDRRPPRAPGQALSVRR
jgi:ribonuclease VapC